MKDILVDFASKLDKDGKYKQADIIENYIKTAQYYNVFQGTSPRQNLVGRQEEIFNPFSQIALTSGFNPALVSSQQVNNMGLSLRQIPRLYALTPSQLQDLKQRLGPAEFAEYVAQEQAGLNENLARLRAGRSINDFVNLMRIVSQVLNSAQTLSDGTIRKYSDADKASIFKSRFFETVATSVQNMILSENNMNLVAEIISKMEKYFNFPEFNGPGVGALGVGIFDAIQKLDPINTTDPASKKKYDDLMPDSPQGQNIFTRLMGALILQF